MIFKRNKLSYKLILITMILSLSLGYCMEGSFAIEPKKDYKLSQKLKKDGGVAVSYKLDTDKDENELEELMDELKESMEKRLDFFNVKDYNIIMNYDTKRLTIEYINRSEYSPLMDTIGKQGKLEFLRVTDDIDEIFVKKGMDKEDFHHKFIADNKKIEKAFLSVDPFIRPAVTIKFNIFGRNTFLEETYFGTPIAVTFDDKVIYGAYISENTDFLQDNFIIAGDFEADKASEISGLINSGVLPVKLDEVHRQIIK